MVFLRNFLSSPVMLSIVCPNILSSVFSNTLTMKYKSHTHTKQAKLYACVHAHIGVDHSPPFNANVWNMGSSIGPYDFMI
jgi:hypothetical protein